MRAGCDYQTFDWDFSGCGEAFIACRTANQAMLVLVVQQIASEQSATMNFSGRDMMKSKTGNLGRTFVWAAGLMIGTSVLPGAAAFAQEDEETARMDAVIVTAQKREQEVQDVPISITAITSEELSDRGINDLNALTGSAPSLAITGNTGLGASNLISMRGISGQSIAIGASQAVAVYLDGVYLPRPEAAFFTLGDVARIEVLRGPQGTLYGRNATGGAINIVTSDPGEEAMGLLDASYGNFDQVIAKASVSGPIGGGFSAGLSGAMDNHDGFYTNLRGGAKLGDLESYTLRGKLRFENDSGFSAQLTADYSDKSLPFVAQNLNRVVGGVLTVPAQLSPPFTPAQVAAFNLSPLVGGFFRSVPGNAASVIPVVYTGDFQVDLDPSNFPLLPSTFENSGVALTLQLPLGENTEVTSITSVRESNTFVNSAALGPLPTGLGTVPFIKTVGANDLTTLNQEIRAVTNLGSAFLTYGINYYKEEADLAFGVRSITETGNTSDLESVGVFGQIEYSLTDRLTVAAGGRFNTDDRTYSGFSLSRCAATAGVCFTNQNVSDETFIPSAQVNYKFTPDILGYASFARGYQAGGFNLSPAVATVPNTFQPETVDAYEIGLKTQFADQRVTLNLAAFQYAYDDLQVKIQISPGIIDVQNAAAAEIQGFEGNLLLQMSDIIGVDASFAYTSAEYEDFCEPVSTGSPANGDAACTNPLGQPGVTRTGRKLNNAPEFTMGTGVNFAFPAGEDLVKGRISYSYQSESYFSAANSLKAGTMNRFDARFGYQMASGLELYAYGKNLTNQERETYIFQVSPVGISNSLNDPRTYGVGVRKTF
jgi:iron complex outermembrane recepter protein